MRVGALISFYLLIIGVCHVQTGQAFLQNGFNLLSDYLDENVDSCDVQENIEAARELLATQSHLPYQQALKLFVSLEETIGKCDWNSFDIIWQNVKATGDTAHKITPPLRRIDNIVQQFSMRHAEHCEVIYQDRYATSLRYMDMVQSKRVAEVTDNIIDYLQAVLSLNRAEPADIYSVWRSDLATLLEANLAMIASETARGIETAARWTINTKYLQPVSEGKKDTVVVNKKQVKDLYETYLLEPCTYFTGSLEEIFIPAGYDAQLFHNDLEDESVVDYHKAWTRFLICRQILDRFSKPLLEALIRSIENKI